MSDQQDKIVKRDFYARDETEQADFLSQTWCNECMEMDLGMKNPVEYTKGNDVWIEGECVKCASKIITEIVEEDE